MAALSRLSPAYLPQAPAGRPAASQPVEAIGGAATPSASPASALQDRVAEAFAAPPSASRLQIVGMGAVVTLATWLAGVMLYASL